MGSTHRCKQRHADPTASRSPTPLRLTDVGHSPGSAMSKSFRPEVVSHRIPELLSDRVASRFPSLLKLTATTWLVWPAKVWSFCPVPVRSGFVHEDAGTVDDQCVAAGIGGSALGAVKESVREACIRESEAPAEPGAFARP